MKEYSISLNDYIEFKQPTYLFLKITPSTSVRNYESDVIINLISRMYRDIKSRVAKINNKLFFECKAKVGYYIYMEKDIVEFYFVVPEKHYSLFQNKITDVWKNRITIQTVDNIPNFSKECLTYALSYKYCDSLSLACDKRNNTLLTTQLNTLHVMKNGDKCGVFYNFIPSWLGSWKADYDRSMQEIKSGMPYEHDKFGIWYIVKLIAHIFCTGCEFVLDVVSAGFGEGNNQQRLTRSLEDFSGNTKKKRDSEVIKVQVICLSESEDKMREHDNIVSLCNSFDCLSEDNKLVYHRIKTKNVNLLDRKIKGASEFTIQSREGQNFISLPGREILAEHKCIEHTMVLEKNVPEDLQHGYICLGENTCHGVVTKAYLRDNYDQGNFPLVLIGEQGAGKTTYLANYVNCILSRNEGCILIDYIKNCELAQEIEKVVSADKLISIDMSDISNVQGIGYNELVPKSNNLLDLLDCSNRKSLYVSMLINALNSDGEPLSTSMDRFLNAASNIVFLDNNASLKDIVKCLNDHVYRHKMIEQIPKGLKDNLDEEIIALNELDDKDKEGYTIGTKSAKVDGVNHRINLLRKDLRLKMMFQKSCEDNIDMVKAMDKGKIILIKMPQEYFSTPYSKNVIVTYLLTKIWAAMLVRGSKTNQPKRFHVIVDEIFQCKTAMQLLKTQEILPQTRKFGCKFVFSCQYLGQINTIDQTLRSAGASHMLMKGSGKANFNEFREELEPYTLEDLEALPQYHSLNLINYEKGRAKFVTKLPRPL